MTPSNPENAAPSGADSPSHTGGPSNFVREIIREDMRTNKWGGHLTYQQYAGDGTATLTPGKNFLLHGCTFIVVCADFNLIPALPKK